VEETRNYVLNYFNAADDYFCIFTPNASGALKIVGESYPFSEDSFLLLSLDNHNSVNGIREFAKKKGGRFQYSPLDVKELKLNEAELMKNLDSQPSKKDKLFAFPAQSNVSGVKHPLAYVKRAQDKGWDVLLDVAAFVPSSRLDLQEVKPDFASVSFYKIFGYPTGLGCLLLKKEKFGKLVKPWYAGGTISLSSATFDGHYLMPNHERFEDGTLNYLDIPAIKIGLQYIEGIGIDTINKRVQSLAGWLLKKLRDLQHSNGNPLIRIFGPEQMDERGGTLVMNFYDKDGKLHPFSFIESEANKRNISIRTGCFCNPGIDETNNCVSAVHLEDYFSAHPDGNFYEMMDFTGHLRGSVRISLGLASNFKDVCAFYQFAQTFLNR
jgi:selenocysteine lyase/cysteine desulfurase